MSVNRNGKYKERTREGSITAIASALSKNLVSGGLGVKLTRNNYYDLAFLNNEQNGDVLNRLGFGLEATKTALAHRVQMYTHRDLGRINLPEDTSQIFESRAFIRTGFEFGAKKDWGRLYLTFDHNLNYGAKIAPSVSLQYYNSQVNNSFRTKLTEFTSRQRTGEPDVFQPSPLETLMTEYKRRNPGVGRKEGSSTLYSLKDLLENSGDEGRQDLIMLNNELSFSEYKVLAQGDEGVIEKPLSVDNIIISERYNNNGQPYYFLDVDKNTVLSVNSIRKMMSRVAKEASTPEARRKHFELLYTRKKSDNPRSNPEAVFTYNKITDLNSLLDNITDKKNDSGQKLNHSLGMVLEEQLSLTTEKLEDLKDDSENLLNDFVETTLDKDYYISKKDEYYKRHGIQNFRNIWKTMIENGSYIPYPMFVPGYNRDPNAVNHLDSLNGTNTEFSYDYLVKNKSKHPLAAALVEQQANYYTERQLNPLSLNAAKTRAFKELLDDSNFHPSRGKTMSKTSSLVLYYNETDDSYAVQAFKHPSANQADKIILGGTSNFNGHSITIDDTNKTKLGTTPTYIVTEGVATAVATAAAFDKTSVVQNGLGVVSAGSALNIKKVVQKIYDTVPNANIIVFADNDFENAHNRILHHLRGELLGAIEPKDVSRSATMADYISTDAGYKTTIEVSKWVSETEKNTGVRPRVAIVTTPFFNKETGKIIKGELKHELYDALTKPIYVKDDSPQQVKDAAARQRQVIASFYPVSEDGKNIDMGKSILSGYSLKLDNDDLAVNVFQGVQSIITENENNAKKQIEEIRNNSTDANPKLASKIHAEARAFAGELRQGAFDVFANRIVNMTNTALKHLDVGNHQYAKASLEADANELRRTTVPKTLIQRTRKQQNRLAKEKSLIEQLSGDALKALTSGLKDEQLQKSADKFLLAHGLYTTTQTSDGSIFSVATEIPRYIGNSEYGKIPTLSYLTARLLNNYTTVPEKSNLYGKLSGGVVSVVMDAIKDKELKEILGADPKDKMPVWSAILQMSEAIHNSAEVVPATPDVKTYMGSARAFESAFIGMAHPDVSDQSVNYVKAYRQLNDKTATGLMMSFGKAEIENQDSTIYKQLTLVNQEQENELLLRRLAVTNMVVEMANEIQAMGSNPNQVRGFYSHIADAIRNSKDRDTMLAEQLDYQKELSSLNLDVKQDVVEKYYQDISDKLVTKLNYSRIDTEDMDLSKLGSGFKAVSPFYAEGVTYKQNEVANMLKNLYPESYVDSLQPYEKKVFENFKENLLLLADRDIAGERKQANALLKEQSKEKEQEMVAGMSAVDTPNVDKPQKESPQKSNESLSPGM